MKRLLPVVVAMVLSVPLSAQSGATDTAAGAAAGLFLLAMIVGALFIYILPTIIAVAKKKQNTAAIALVNLLLGWSFIGWVVALVWAVTVDPQPVIVQKSAPPLTSPIPQAAAALLCSTCGKYSVPTAKFCAHCGVALVPSVAPVPPAPTTP